MRAGHRKARSGDPLQFLAALRAFRSYPSNKQEKVKNQGNYLITKILVQTYGRVEKI